MLPKNHKLNSVEFTKVFDSGKTIHSPNCMYKVMYENTSGVKAAAVVSKKHTKTAIVRNYKRRQLYHIAKKYLDLGTTQPVWVIIIMKKSGLVLPFGELENEVREVLEKL